MAKLLGSHIAHGDDKAGLAAQSRFDPAHVGVVEALDIAPENAVVFFEVLFRQIPEYPQRHDLRTQRPAFAFERAFGERIEREPQVFGGPLEAIRGALAVNEQNWNRLADG